MPGDVTEITEIATALGTLRSDLESALVARPPELRNVCDDTWTRVVDAYGRGNHASSFRTAFDNGLAFLRAGDALRGRLPNIVEWKGPDRTPGDDVIPCDLRIDHVYLVSCKYLSRVLLNVGPARLFDRLLVGESRAATNWFHEVAPDQFQDFYEAAVRETGVRALPGAAAEVSAEEQRELRARLRTRALPTSMHAPWNALCEAVATASAQRWRDAMVPDKARLRTLWRLLRITDASYYVLGTDRSAHLRLRVSSTWDWNKAFELCGFSIGVRPSGQPEVGWRASIRNRRTGDETVVEGHVEIRWSHGRFVGSPEAKVYLDTPHASVPGYHTLV